MFIGETLNLIVFYCYHTVAKKPKPSLKFSPLIFALPACCDLAATSIMYIGFTLTYASVVQMMRGAVVIFTGIFSVVFLKRKLYRYNWVGMFLVLVGLAIVGTGSVIQGGTDTFAPNPLLGDLLVVGAQIIVAAQMVIEEKFLSKYEVPPMLVVGWEGIFGFTFVSLLLIPFYWIPSMPGGGNTGGSFDNAVDAFVQMSNSYLVCLALAANTISIAFFNFFGVSITKYSSATTRMVLDTVRTVILWMIYLAAGEQPFQYMQLIGYPILVFGMALYNQLIPINSPWFRNMEKEEEREPLLEQPSNVN